MSSLQAVSGTHRVGEHRSFVLLAATLALLASTTCGDSSTGPKDGRRAQALALTTAPSATAQNRTPFASQPVVQARDNGGNDVARGGIVITAAITDGGGTLRGTTSVATASTGAASFTNLSIAGTAGLRTLTFSAPGLTSATATVTLTAGVAARIGVNAGNNRSAPPGWAVPVPPSVIVTDADANPVSGVEVSFAVASGGGSITGERQTTDASGLATVGSWTLGPAEGVNTLSATAAGLAGSPVTFVVTAVAPLMYDRLVTGSVHACGVASGMAYCWGSNQSGQLGTGTSTGQEDCGGACSTTPVALSGGLSFAELAAGGERTCGIATSGAAYCWGTGALGNESTTSVATPVPVSGGLIFTALATRHLHTCGIAASDEAYCWGYNYYGQLGIGSRAGPEICGPNDFWTCSRTPLPVSGGLTFSVLAAGWEHNCGLTSSGAAYCWGSNAIGQLGNGTTTGPEQCSDRPCSTTPVAVSGGLTFSAIAAGTSFTCGLTDQGAAYCWGSNGLGQLGNGSTTHDSMPVAVSGGLIFTALAAGDGHACGSTASGAAYCWGFNDYGQLGNGTYSGPQTCSPGAVVAPCSRTPVLVSGGLSWSALAGGSQFTCGLTNSGAAYCWGRGSANLGNGTTTGVEQCGLNGPCSTTPVPVFGPAPPKS